MRDENNLTVARLTICVPKTLREKMRKVDRDFNWSRIATQAFEDALERGDSLLSVRDLIDALQCRVAKLERINGR